MGVGWSKLEVPDELSITWILKTRSPLRSKRGSSFSGVFCEKKFRALHSAERSHQEEQDHCAANRYQNAVQVEPGHTLAAHRIHQ